MNTGKSNLYNEMKNWKKNKNETCKLAETRDLFEKQLARTNRAYARETEKLYKEFGTKIVKATPSVDEYLGRKLKRQLDIPDVHDMPPEMTKILYPKENSGASSKDAPADSVDTISDSDKTSDLDGKDQEDTESETTEEEGESNEPVMPDWYVGRRRFTLAALNDIPEHLIQARRGSTGSADLAAILDVKVSEIKL